IRALNWPMYSPDRGDRPSSAPLARIDASVAHQLPPAGFFCTSGGVQSAAYRSLGPKNVADWRMNIGSIPIVLTKAAYAWAPASISATVAPAPKRAAQALCAAFLLSPGRCG